MSKWSHVEGKIRCKNYGGVKHILSEQKFETEPWEHYNNPYNSLSGSEGDVKFIYNEEKTELIISGDLRDVCTIPEEKEDIIKDFKKIIELVEGKGYIQIRFEYEGTIVVDYYGEYDCRIFPQADGWHQYYENIIKFQLVKEG